ncbi:hypothetical protein M3201_16525 [Paenibacillus motobuensis]|uniref:hypothetical protein n=1 Tax=Paenibacillus TaxID=44249 RepID=UPI00203F7C76|nr:MULTISPECIES: hypothetical protein [Paenibacillus]MCM3041312.1 hypothetical protein [Paenibacillus lutimineralis]MCM3648416.1 hypothetical protein [Paenibacillus motobuensis]
MNNDILDEMHKLDHHDEQRYRLLMRYLRLLQNERKQHGFLKKFRKQWNMCNSKKEIGK